MSDMIATKPCTRCGRSLPATAEHFGWAVKGKQLRSRCKPCQKDIHREMHELHRRQVRKQRDAELKRRRKKAPPTTESNPGEDRCCTR